MSDETITTTTEDTEMIVTDPMAGSGPVPGAMVGDESTRMSFDPTAANSTDTHVYDIIDDSRGTGANFGIQSGNAFPVLYTRATWANFDECWNDDGVEHYTGRVEYQLGDGVTHEGIIVKKEGQNSYELQPIGESTGPIDPSKAHITAFTEVKGTARFDDSATVYSAHGYPGIRFNGSSWERDSGAYKFSDGRTFLGRVTYYVDGGEPLEGQILPDEDGNYALFAITDTDHKNPITGATITELHSDNPDDPIMQLTDTVGRSEAIATNIRAVGHDNYHIKTDGYVALSNNEAASEEHGSYVLKYEKDSNGQNQPIRYFDKQEGLEAYLEREYNFSSLPEEEKAKLLATHRLDPDKVSGSEERDRISADSVMPWATEAINKENGVGSVDRPDVHDEYMHETHVTQTTGSDNAGWGAFGNMNKDGTAKEAGSYDAGITSGGANAQRTTLANNERLLEIMQVTGNPLGRTSSSKFSPIDYIATYAATGQYNVSDLKLMVDSLKANGYEFGEQYPDKYFYGTIYEQKYKELGLPDEKKWGYTVNDLMEEVEELKKQVQLAHEKFQRWEGSASKSEKEAIETIIGKFEVTMGNIESALKPACESLDELCDCLITLKASEDRLFHLKGQGIGDKDYSLVDGCPSDVTYLTSAGAASWGCNLRELERLLSDATKAYNQAKEKVGSKPVQKDDETDSDYTLRVQDWNRDNITVETKLKEKNNLEKAKEHLINNYIIPQQEKCNDDFLEMLDKYYKIVSFEQTLNTFESFFVGDGFKNRRGVNLEDRSSWIESKDSLLLHGDASSHDSVIKLFEDYSQMPVITPLHGYYGVDESGHSVVIDYKVGDVILHDDAHGYIYAVTGEFDPLTGTIRVACFDRTGKKIGTDVTIWDQREIVPIGYAREIFPEEYSSIPDHFEVKSVERTSEQSSEKSTERKTGETSTEVSTEGSTEGSTERRSERSTERSTERGTGEPGTESHTESHSERQTESGIEQGTEGRSGTPTISTEPRTYNPNPWFTDSYSSDSGYGGYGGYDGNGPHTGLDAMYNINGETRQSSAALGALAGLAAGAAGLGLTGLVGDKEDKEEDEEKGEKKKEVKEETNKEENSNTSMFF